MKTSLNRSTFMGKSGRHLVRSVSLTLAASLLFSGLSLFTIPVAQAVDPSVTLPATFDATTSFATVSGVSVSNYTNVQATISVSTGNIKISTTTGLTAPTGYSSADWTSNSSTVIAFSGTQANVNNALATLQYKATAIGTAGTITVATFASSAAYDASSGRIYEVVNHGAKINWELARCKAKYSNSDVSYSGTSTRNNDRCTSSTALTRRTASGLKGYLVNITSLAEHEFLMSKLNDVGWIGGADTDSEGTFIWMDGPEAGQVFFTPGQTSRRGSYTVSGSVPGFSYGANRFNYFSDGEPNDSSGEDFAEFGFGSAGVGRSWNDCQNGCNRSKYVIEYGGEDGETLQGASGTIAVRTAPTAPTSVSPTAGALQASLTWAAPSSTGGTPVTGYLIEYKASGGSWVTATSNTGSDTRSYTVTGLSGATNYTFRISAINNAGTSSASTESAGVTTSKATPTFSAWSNVSKTFGDANYTVTAPTVTGSLAGSFSYSSSNTGVISISGTTFSVAGGGSATITATFTPTNATDYTSATTTMTVSVARATPTISSWADVSKTFGDSTYTVIAPTASVGGTFSYSSSNTGVISISGTTFTVRAVGSTTITATFTPTNATDYTSATTTNTVSVARATPTFSAWSNLSKTFGDSPFTVTAPTVTGSLAGSFTYSSSNTGVISISADTTLTVAGAGSATITATFTPTDSSSYNSATTTMTVSVARATPTFSAWSNVSKTFGDSPYTVTAPTASVGGTFSYSSSNTGVISISAGTTLTVAGAGSTTITATFTPINATDYTSAIITNTVSVARSTASATISLTGEPLTFRKASTVSAVSSVAGKVTFRVNGKVLPGCKNRTVIAGTATCTYRPSTRGFVSVTATLDPTDASYIGTTTTTTRYFVGNRTGPRGG